MRPAMLLPLILIALSYELADADEFAFRRHVIDKASEFGACAAIDVNRDGRLDIVCGGSWYEAPNWQPHKARDVELIRGRYDDYSNLPLDVNGDGRTDLVSVNYRSRSLYWVEHPAEPLGTWRKQAIDTPGPSETGRLADVNSDGRLDVLPNGMEFAAWYEVAFEPAGDGSPQVRWLRHDLPRELIGHGIGCGDINGDGRNDVVGPRGWAEAPQDARTGGWVWHPEFTLHRDSSVPILVHDVDGDNDTDVIWGRGHDTGLYWAEQFADGTGKRAWVQHAIDTSWSQPHSIMLADMDGDGRQDLVAGKRYLGHDGKDPGEYDPLVIYWYGFQSETKTWRRHLVSRGEDCGFDLDPKCEDLDGDGDMDILAPARSGLCWLENLRIDARGAGAIGAGLPPLGADLPTPPKPPALGADLPTPPKPPTAGLPAVPTYTDHANLLVYQDAAGQQQPVQTPWHWGIRRQHVLWNMERVTGPLPNPECRVPLDVQILEETETDHYMRRKITYGAEPGDRVPALLLVPKKRSGRTPAMLCLHPTSPLGKAQICGLDGNPTRFYAHELAERGYVCLAPDYPSFGDYAYDFKTAGAHHASGTIKGIWNHIRGVDLLESLPEVNPDRIGCIGHSLGGHNALFVAAFDQRLRAVVTSCGFNAFEDYYGGDLKGWTSDRYMPRIRDEYGCDPKRMPFDFHEILGAIAPRPVFINAPLHDSNFEVVGVRKAVTSAVEIYRLRNAEDNLHVIYPDAGHDFPDDVRTAVYEWLDARLDLRKSS